MNDKRLLQLEALMASDPNDPFLPYAIAQEYASAENYVEAVQRLNELKIKFPDYLPTYYQLGLSLIRVNKLEEAMETLQTGYTLAMRQSDRKTAAEIAAVIEELEDEL